MLIVNGKRNKNRNSKKGPYGNSRIEEYNIRIFVITKFNCRMETQC